MSRSTIIGVVGALVVLVALALNLYFNREPELVQGTGVGTSDVAVETPEADEPSAQGMATSENVARTSQGAGAAVPGAPGRAAVPQEAQRPGGDAERTGSQTEADVAPSAASPGDGSASPDIASTRPGGEVAASIEEPEVSASDAPTAVPRFDVVRIDPAGDAVFAGRAAPGAEVTVRDAGEPLGTVTADRRGEWVYVPDKALPAGSRELSLDATDPDGTVTQSDNVVVLVVPEKGKDIAGNPAQQQSEPLALMVPRSGAGGAKVLQKPSVPGSVESPNGELSLESIDYGDSGELELTGQAQPEADVLVYLDNQPIGQARADSDGNWRIRPEQPVSPGVYKLRVDQSVAGDVTARLELPFSRAEPLSDFASEAFVIVQPGNSLWRIARRTLGTGMRYTVIYTANKDQIGDPDLIYPGQVFAIPTTN